MSSKINFQVNNGLDVGGNTVISSAGHAYFTSVTTPQILVNGSINLLDTANAAFDQANTGTSLAQAAFDSGNTTLTYAQSAYNAANNAGGALSINNITSANSGTNYIGGVISGVSLPLNTTQLDVSFGLGYTPSTGTLSVGDMFEGIPGQINVLGYANQNKIVIDGYDGSNQASMTVPNIYVTDPSGMDSGFVGVKGGGVNSISLFGYSGQVAAQSINLHPTTFGNPTNIKIVNSSYVDKVVIDGGDDMMGTPGYIKLNDTMGNQAIKLDSYNSNLSIPGPIIYVNSDSSNGTSMTATQFSISSGIGNDGYFNLGGIYASRGTDTIVDIEDFFESPLNSRKRKYHHGIWGGTSGSAYGGANIYETQHLYANTSDSTIVYASTSGNQSNPQAFGGNVANGEVALFETTIIAQSHGAAGSNAFDGTKIWKYETVVTQSPTGGTTTEITSQQTSNTGNSGTWTADVIVAVNGYGSGAATDIKVQGENAKQIFWYVTHTKKSLWCTFEQGAGGGGGGGK